MASWAAERASAGCDARRASGAQRALPTGQDPGVGTIAFGAQDKRRLSLVGFAAVISVDEEVADSGGAVRRQSECGFGENRDPELVVSAACWNQGGSV